MLLEVIATTVQDAIEIEKGGGDRIELVSALEVGGLTPSYGLIEAVVNAVDIPVYTMIRPHAHSFVYTVAEIELMKKDIKIAKDLGSDGVVLGVLTPCNQIAHEQLKDLLSVTEGLDVTFHRAIDETDVVGSMIELANYAEIKTVLTSGGLTNPLEENIPDINKMSKASGHINVLIGGGLKMDNINRVASKVLTNHFHVGSAAMVNGQVKAELVRKVKEQISK